MLGRAFGLPRLSCWVLVNHSKQRLMSLLQTLKNLNTPPFRSLVFDETIQHPVKPKMELLFHGFRLPVFPYFQGDGTAAQGILEIHNLLSEPMTALLGKLHRSSEILCVIIVLPQSLVETYRLRILHRPFGAAFYNVWLSCVSSIACL